MAVVHVRHLVAQDHRELGLVVEPGEEAGVDVDPTVGHREGVQCRIADHAEPEPRAAGRAHLLRQELVTEPAEVLVEQWVVVGLRLLEEGLLFLLGLGPEPQLVGLGLERLAARADRRHVA